jgi:hypothetical protein
VARRCQGAKIAVQLGLRRDRESEDADRVAADIFSITIREYSVGEHLPSAIIAPRRPMVSQEASASSIIISGRTDFLRRRFLMSSRCGMETPAGRKSLSGAALHVVHAPGGLIAHAALPSRGGNHVRVIAEPFR